MVSSHQERFLCLLKPVPPLLKCQFHCEQLPVADVLVALGGREAAGEEGTRVKLLVGGPLRENTSYANTRGVHVHHELLVGVGRMEAVVNLSFRVRKAAAASFG